MFMKPELKPRFKERMLSLLSNPEDFAKFESIIHKHPRNFIRCNTLKISPRELVSMLPPIALNPLPGELVLDLCASPGSKTTQIAAAMQNQGTLIANDLKIDRIMILSSNLERCGVSNVIATRNDAIALCSRLAKSEFKFDKI